MKSKPKSPQKRTTLKTKRSSNKATSRTQAPSRALPRCTRCGSKTVHLDRMDQELLATISLHCLICGHHAFLGKPVVRLIRRPNIPNPLALKKIRQAV